LNTLRQKILAKFTPKIPPVSNKNNKFIDKPISVSIKKISLSIPTKSQKEVKQISKYFKNIKLANVTKQPPKSYTQASKQGTSTSEVIKIKDAFSALDIKKIDQIQNIVNNNSKAKPCIQMMTKRLSRKQIIILISSENTTKFMKNSFLHIVNINRSLRTVKSEVLVDFIQSDQMGIMVVTRKVAVQLDLLIIKNYYIKNMDNIDSLNMEVS